MRESTDHTPETGNPGPERAFLGDMAKYLPAQVVPGVVGVLSVPVITRLFAPEEYGVFSVAMATVMLAVTLFGWVPTAVIRFHPNAEKDGTLPTFCSTVQGLAIGLALAGVVVGAIVLSSAQHALPAELRHLLWIGLAVFAVESLFVTYQHLLRARRHVGWYSTFASLKSVGTLGLGVLAVLLLGLGVEGLLWGAIVTTTLLLPFALRRALGRLPVLRLRIDPGLASAMARYGVPLVVGNIAAWVLSLSDRYIIEFSRGSHEVGIYSVSYDIGSRSTMLLVTLFMLASGPIAMRVWERHGEERSRQFIGNVARYSLIVSVPAVTGLVALGRPLMAVMAGPEFREGYRILGYVGFGVLLLGMQQAFQTGLLFHKRTTLLTGAVLASGTLNVVLNLLFVPEHGYVAAAATTLASYAFLLVLMIVLSRKYLTWPFPFATLFRVVTASALMATVLFVSRGALALTPGVELLAGTVAGGVVYAAALLGLRELRPAELETLRRLARRLRRGGGEPG